MEQKSVTKQEERKSLLCEMAVDPSAWEKLDEIKKLKNSDPERWEKSRMFVENMKILEELIAKKVRSSKSKVDLLDLELIVCIHNLFVCLSS